MEKKATLGTMLTLLVASMLTLALNIQPVKALQTIYIRANGSVDPPTAPVSNVDNVTYTITANIYSYFVVVQKDNIVVDGARHLLYGDGAYDSKGIDLTGRKNVTIKNCRIQRFGHGIFLDSSPDNTILGNNISGLPNNRVGITVHSSKGIKILGNYIAQNGMALAMSSCSNSTISGNNIENNWGGFHIEHLSNNTFCRNNITGHESYGIKFYYSTNNIVSENNITNSGQYSIELGLSSSYNYIYHNNFGDKPIKVYAQDCINVWDNGYPSGGNYWGDYVTKYPDAQELDDSGIWDKPYNIDENNRDNYPLIKPWTPIPTTIDELKKRIVEFFSEGEIYSQGIVNSLVSKLDVTQKLVDKGKINAAKTILENGFISQVQNLSGIQIAVDAAHILAESAQCIMSHL